MQSTPSQSNPLLNSDSWTWQLIQIIVGAILGYGVSLWRNRLLPWVTLLRFNDTIETSAMVKTPATLVAASARSWLLGPPIEAESPLGQIRKVAFEADAFLRRNLSSIDLLSDGITSLRSATTNDEVRGALLPLLMHDGIRLFLGLAIWREAMTAPVPDVGRPRLYPYAPRSDFEGGCYIIRYGEHPILIGGDLAENAIFAQSLQPYLEVLSTLQQDALVGIFEALLPLMRDQVEIQKVIWTDSIPPLLEHSRWTAEFTVTNYGSAPFLLFPNQADMVVFKYPETRKFVLPGHITYQQDDGEWIGFPGTFLIAPENAYHFRLVTNSREFEIPEAAALRKAWETGTAEGYIRLRVKGRELPGARRVKSIRIAFRK